jgi:hypothetical protein
VPRVTVRTQTAAGAARNGVTVTMTHASDASCASGESYTLGATASGSIVRAVPLGIFTVAATGASTTSCTGSGTGSGATGLVTGSGSAITSTPCRVQLTSTGTMPNALFKW